MPHQVSKLAAMLRPRPHRFALESRQLFDGAALVEAAHAVDAQDAAHAAPAPAEAARLPATAEAPPAQKAVVEAASRTATMDAAPAAATTPHAVYVVDQSVLDWQQMVQALPSGSEVILIDKQSDGVAQLAAALQGRHDVSALQIVSHGAEGQITLGSSVVTADNLFAHAAEWASIGASLTAGGDILLYGCDVASNDDTLLVRMSALTGADVAASTDATGAVAKGGNWTLERSVGQIEATALNDVDYQDLLAAPAVTSSATKLSVSEFSTLNAPGLDQVTLSGWNITNGGVGNVTVVVQIDSDDLDSVPDLAVGGLTVGPGGTAASTLSFTGTAAAATAWVNSLVLKATDIELGNTAAKAVLRVDVTDAATSLTATRSLDVTVTPSNDPVTLTTQPQSVTEGSNTVLTAATLKALDPEVTIGTQNPAQIVYSVTANPQYGYLTLDAVRLGIGSVFTQQDVIDGKVHYIHTATGATQNTPDSFGVRANDGATPVAQSAAATVALNISPVNQAPTVGGSGVVYEGQPANAVDSGGVARSQVGNFIVADGGGDDASSAMTVKLTALPTDGTLFYTGTATVNGASVTYATPHAITAGEIATGAGFVIAYDARAGLTYANTGTRDNTGAGSYPYVDGFKVIVSDGGGGTGVPGSTAETTIAINVRPVNDDPTYTGQTAPQATVTAAGDQVGTYKGSYTVTLTTAMINATDVDSSNGRLTFAVTSQAGLDQGYLLLNGVRLAAGGVFTLADVASGKVQYVQIAGASPANATDTFQFQVIDNTIGIRWNADGTSISRLGGVYDNLGDPGRVDDDALHTYNFTVNLAQTGTGNGGPFPPDIKTPILSSSTYAGTDNGGQTRGLLVEDGTVVISGDPTSTSPYLSYSIDGVPPEQVVYTILGLADGGADWNGAIQRQASAGVWVDLNVYGTFTQADLNNGNIRYKHDGTSEDFQSNVRLSASAGVLVQSTPNGPFVPDVWNTTFNFYVTPTNDAPVVIGSSNTVITEGEIANITSGMLQISDPDDASSEGYLESPAQGGTGTLTAPGGGNNYAYNNDTTGANSLRFVIDSLPPGGTLEYLSGGNWIAVVAGMTVIDASVLKGDAASTGLRFVSDGSEVRNTSFTVHAIDRWNQSSNSATVSIQITNVNDAPQIAANPNLPDPAGAVNNPLIGVAEGSSAQITSAMLAAFDPDSSKGQVQYRITSAPSHGSVAFSTDGGLSFKFLGVGSSFTQADVDAGRVYYVNNGDEGDGKTPGSTPASDSFGFSLGDGDKEQPGNQFWIYTVPGNDLPTVVAPAAADVFGNGTAPVAIGGISVNDVDLDTVIAGEEDFLRVEVSVVDAANAVVTDARINTTGATPSSPRGLLSGGNTSTLVIQGTRAEVNAALSNLNLAFNTDQDSSTLRLRTTVDDRLYSAGGVLASGANGGTTATQNDNATPIDAAHNRASAFTALNVSNFNDAPTLTGSPTISVTEDTPLLLSNANLTLSDVDSFGRDVTVTVQLFSDAGHSTLANSTTQGRFLIGATTGLTASTGGGTNTVSLTGSLAEVKAALDLMRIATAVDFNNGPLYMRTTVADFAHADGGKQAVTDTTVNVLPVNDAPTLTVPTDKVLNSGASLPLSGYTIGDARDLSQGATDYVEVTVRALLPLPGGGPAGNLAVTASGTATIDTNGSPVIVVKGTFADVQATLNTMVFTPNNNNADVRVTINTVVDDKSNGAENNPAGTGNNLATGNFFVNISSVNDAPVIAAPTTLSVNEDSTGNLVSGISITDPDDFGAVESVTLDLGAGAKGTIALSTTAGLSFSIGNGTATDKMVFTGTKTAINAALATLRFTPTPNTNTVATTQTLTITVNDLGNTGTGGALSDTETVAITIVPVNDAPVRNGAGAAVLPPATEDVADGPSGTVASLFSGSFYDQLDTVTGGSNANAFAGIAITANAAIPAQGVWQYSTDGTTWTNLPAVSTANAFLLNPSDSLRFVPAANYFGTPGQLTARLIDGSGAAFTTGTRANVSNDTTLSGGTTRYSNSANAVTLATTAANVNDRPIAANVTVPAGVEDNTVVTGTSISTLFSGVSYSDATDNQTGIAGGGDQSTALGGVAIVGNASTAAQGTWQYSTDSGASWTVLPTTLNDQSAVQLSNTALLRFVPAANFNGTPAGLIVRVSDTPVINAGNVDLGPSATLDADATSHWSLRQTVGTSIAPRNDAPVLGGTTGDHPVTENAGVGTGVPNVALVSNVTLIDLDLGTTSGLTVFGAGSITVSLGATYVVGDELFVSGALPTGVTFTGGTNGANLVISFDADTTAAEITDVVSRLTWRSTSDNPTVFGDPGKGQRTYTVVVNDGNNQQPGGNAGGPGSLNSNVLSGTITITPVNDAPVANNDVRSVAEDAAPITGNVIANGSAGDVADTDLDNRPADLSAISIRTGAEAGTGTAGAIATGLAGSYGTLVLNANGSYSYTVNNANPSVNALKDGQTLTETYTYTISDGAGGTDTAQLTITIQGHTDGVPSIVPVDGNSTATGEATVFEAGLTPDGPAGQSRTTTGAINLSALDGLSSVTVGGTTLTLAQLQALSAATPSAAIDTGEGTLVLTGFTATIPNGIVTGGSLSYTYSLKTFLSQPAATATTDAIALVVTDVSAATSNATLTVQIVDDAPTARPDTNSLTEDAPVNTVSGNVVTTGAGADRLGADGASPSGPVTAVSYGPTIGTVGASLATAYGAVVLNADGSYTYTLNNANPTVNALKNGQTLTEVVTYRITDGDGDTSTTTLTITINGHDDGIPSIAPLDSNGPGAAGEVTVLEHGLVDGIGGPDTTERSTGTLNLTALDGLKSVTVGGVVVTLAQLQALGTTNVTVDTPDGTIVLTGFVGGNTVGGVPTTGALTFSYTLKAPITNTAGETEAARTVALAVTDAGNATSSGTLTVRIVDDVPTAVADTDAVTEDGPATVTGNVVTGAGQDSLGADGSAVTGPVTAVSFGGAPRTVGTAFAAAYGTVTLNADGSYSYVLDNANPAVNALLNGQTLTDVVAYTVTDRDGDTSTTTLTITISGQTDGAPGITPVDGNGAGAAGQIDVSERGLISAGDASEIGTGSVNIVAGDGLRSITVGTGTFTLAQLQALGTTPQTVDTPDGTVVLTAFTPTTVNGIVTGGSLAYSYTLKAAIANATGATETTRSVALSVTDAANVTGTGTLVVRIVDDVPTANADVNAVTEDGTATVTGNVVTTGPGADRIGADGAALAGPVTTVSFGGTPRTVGTAFASVYGTVVLNADGSYTYLLDNGNPAVNALKTGDTLSEVVTYTLTDRDGDTSTTTLTITINGHTDGAPGIGPVDGNGTNVNGQATVYESGITLDGPAGENRSANGTVTLNAPDGLQSFQVEGATVTLAQLQALGTTSRTIDTGEGTLVLNGFNSVVVGGIVVGGDVSYAYTLKAPIGQPGATDSADAISVGVTDAAGVTSASTLTVQIVDDAPTARADTAAVTEDGTPTVSGNVVTTGAGADRLGADGAATAGPVTAVSFGVTTGTVGTALTTAYGSIVLNADGSYNYTLDNNNAVVNALKDGETLTETVNYTITDSDGDTSTTTLTVTINGHTDAASGPSIIAVDNNGAATGQTDVLEHGLTSAADSSETNGGTIVIAAADGLQSITVGGTTLSLTTLANLSPATPVVVQTPPGTLTLTGFAGADLVGGVPTRGTLSYSYALDGQLAQPGATESTDPIALVVTDAGNVSSTGTLAIRIVDDVPVAAPDVDTVSEDGVTIVTGNVRANDTLGADDANGVPVTGVAFGGHAGTVGSPLATAYGSIVVSADGGYTYTLDNANPAVQHLVAGETLTETVTYTITDADGDTSVATLTVTVQGRNDVATLQIVEGNGSDIGQATVNERGLGDGGDASETTTGRFVIGTPDGLQNIQLGNTIVTPAQLAALGGTPILIATDRGQLTLTGFDPATGTVSYSYTLGGRAPHGGGEVTDDILVAVTDRNGDTTSATLNVRVVDDGPTALSDAASLGIALPNATVRGNLFGPAGRGPGDVADRLGADVTPTPVSGFSFEGRAGTVGGAPLAGAYGSLRLNADGTYVYAVNDQQARVAALGDGQTLTEVFTYTITDADGSSSTAQLVITIRGASTVRPLTSDQIFPVDFKTETRRITQGMEPALFVQLAVRESERISLAATATIASRVAGGDTTYGGEQWLSPTLRIDHDMDNVQHVSRDGVAFSLQMLADLRQSLAVRGLGQALPDGANALFGDFPGFTAPDANDVRTTGPAPSEASPRAERIVVPTARPHADASAKAGLPLPKAQVEGARSFSQRLAVAAGERGSVRDLMRTPQQREAERVKVKQVTQ